MIACIVAAVVFALTVAHVRVRLIVRARERRAHASAERELNEAYATMYGNGFASPVCSCTRVVLDGCFRHRTCDGECVLLPGSTLPCAHKPGFCRDIP